LHIVLYSFKPQFHIYIFSIVEKFGSLSQYIYESAEITQKCLHIFELFKKGGDGFGCGVDVGGKDISQFAIMNAIQIVGIIELEFFFV
tara:strand:+ start:432 stop:695 length:264 start_codon:yes stop_codon:yes gene_type:complete